MTGREGEQNDRRERPRRIDGHGTTIVTFAR